MPDNIISFSGNDGYISTVDENLENEFDGLSLGDHQQINFHPVDDGTSIKSSPQHPHKRWEQLIHALKPLFIRRNPGEEEYNDNGMAGNRRRMSYDVGLLKRLGGGQNEQRTMSEIELLNMAQSPISAQSSPTQYSFDDQRSFGSFGRRNRRSTMDLPRSSMYNIHQHHHVSAKERLRDAVERIKHLKLPMNLLRRRHAKDEENLRHQTRINEFSAAVSVPFLGLSRDEHGRKSVPVLVEFMNLMVKECDDNLFCIELQYGNMRWSITRSMVEIMRLHSSLTFRHLQHKLSHIPKFPSQIHYALAKAKTYALPAQSDFVSREFLLARLMSQRRKSIESYLKQVLLACRGKNFSELWIFFELGTILTGGWKGKEGFLKKRTQNTGNKSRILCFGMFKGRKRRVWLTVRDSYIAYFDNIQDYHPREVILLDQQSNCKAFKVHGIKRHRFQLNNQVRSLILAAESERQMQDFIGDISFAIKNSLWCKIHPNNSFAPVRSGTFAKFFVDGQDYYNDVYATIKSAKRNVYISDWWLSPEVYLQRPPCEHPESRLDRLLASKAKEGVKIYVILYKEVSYALDIDSAYSKQCLTKLHRFIKVLRYPDHAPGGILYWALHDKIVVVDETVAFCGGLDLCMGRFDNHLHLVGDYPEGSSNEIWPGIDYSNPRISDFRNVQEYQKCLIDKRSTARMPWYDFGYPFFVIISRHDVHSKINGAAAQDLARHFVQRWNFIKSIKSRDRDDIPYLIPPSEQVTCSIEGTCDVQVVRSVSYWSMGVPREQSIYEAYLLHIQQAKHYIYIENQFFLSSTDNSQSNSIRNRISEALCQRIIRAFKEGKTFRVFVVIPLFPAFENEVDNTDAATVRLIVHWHQMTICKGESSIIATLMANGIQDPFEYICFCSLRNHGRLMNSPSAPMVSEQVYIHSKLLIVDDRVAIIGTANINDRSLMGNRDSEVALVIQDSHLISSKMNGRDFMVGKFAHDLRKTLFAEHLGLQFSDPCLQDIVSTDFYRGKWLSTADINTAIYREVFRCLPDDTVQSWDDYQNFVEIPFKQQPGHVGTTAPKELYEPMLKRIHGNLVFYPINFLSKENLSVIFPAPEYLVPMDVFV